MIDHHATEQDFLRDNDERNIDDVVGALLFAATDNRGCASEIRSWRESLTRMSGGTGAVR